MIRYSIVIPTKDRVQLCNRLISTLDAAIVASGLNKSIFEIIVADDSGVKHEYISKVLKPHVLVCRKNAAGARNLGASAAKGRYIAFFDDDLVIPKDYFSTLDAITKRYDFEILEGRQYPMRIHAADIFFAVMMVYFRRCGFMPGFNLIIKKSFFDKLKFDDTDEFAPVEDYKYFFDAMQQKPKVYYSKKLNVTHETVSYRLLLRRIRNYSKGRMRVHKALPKDYPQLPMNKIIELDDGRPYIERFKGIGVLMRIRLRLLLVLTYIIFLFYNRRILIDFRIIRRHLKDLLELEMVRWKNVR